MNKKPLEDFREWAIQNASGFAAFAADENHMYVICGGNMNATLRIEILYIFIEDVIHRISMTSIQRTRIKEPHLRALARTAPDTASA